jgi:hypothetical protein
MAQPASSAAYRLDELGYFYPNLPEPSDAAVVTIGKEVYYRDVNRFIQRIRDVAASRGEAVLQLHLFGNLRGSAMEWYADQIDQNAKLTLRYYPLEQGWIKMLSDRFKPVFDEAVDKLNRLRITIQDIRNGADVTSFASEVIRHARASECTTIHQQLIQVWIRMDADMQLMIPRPTNMTTMQEFFAQLDEKRSIWQRRAYQVPRTYRPQPQGQMQPQQYQYAQTPYYGSMESLMSPANSSRSNGPQPYARPYRPPTGRGGLGGRMQNWFDDRQQAYNRENWGSRPQYRSGNQYRPPAGQGQSNQRQLPWQSNTPQKQIANKPYNQDDRQTKPSERANHAAAYNAEPETREQQETPMPTAYGEYAPETQP